MLQKNFTLSAVVFGLLSALSVSQIMSAKYSRVPASQDNLELEIKTIQLTKTSSLKAVENAHLRVTFKNQKAIDANDTIKLSAGQSLVVDHKVEVKPQWIENNTLEFKVELVGHNAIGMEQIIVRCQQVSKEVLDFARGYQCALPGESQAFLTYRLGTKNQNSKVNMASK